MTYKTIAARVPENIDRYLKEIMIEERLDKSATTRKILELGICEWRKEKALKLLREKKVTLTKAAELAGISVFDFIELVKSVHLDYIYITNDELDKESVLAKSD